MTCQKERVLQSDSWAKILHTYGWQFCAFELGSSTEESHKTENEVGNDVIPKTSCDFKWDGISFQTSCNKDYPKPNQIFQWTSFILHVSSQASLLNFSKKVGIEIIRSHSSPFSLSFLWSMQCTASYFRKAEKKNKCHFWHYIVKFLQY